MENKFSYAGKRSLVVGCYSGMGAATAQIVKSLGGTVHGVDYKQPDYALDGYTSCDLRDAAQVQALVDGLDGTFDAVFYCAGLPQTHPAIDVMKVNFAAMRAVVEGVHPKVNRGGAISIISSNAGLQFMSHMAEIFELCATDGFQDAVDWSAAHPELVADGYGFSKEAIIVYTMKRALEVVGDGVRVNCISPGPTATPMMPEFEKAAGAEVIAAFHGPMERKAQPDEMGWPLVFLNSDAASFITGVNLLVDAGFVAGMMTGAINLEELMGQAMASIADRGAQPSS